MTATSTAGGGTASVLHPEPLRHTGHLIRRAQQLHAALWNRDVSSSVSSVQFAALTVLARQPQISQRELGDLLDLDRSTIADLVTRMLRRGVLERHPSTVDRRRYRLVLTPSGLAELAYLSPRVEQLEHALTDALTATERAQLRERLQQMLSHAASVN